MKVDIGSENFDLYFYQQIEKMGPNDKEKLPRDVVSTLWTKDGRVNNRGLQKFNFIQRLYILWMGGGKHINVVIRDDAGGFSPEQFLECDKRKKKKDWSVDAVGSIGLDPGFVLGNKELCDSFWYLNYLCNHPAYNYVHKVKNPIPNHMVEWRKQMVDFVRVLRTWEGNKKRLVGEYSISIPELYVLIALYGEREIPGSTIYRETFKRSFQSSVTKIKVAFGTLQERGYIEKIGDRKASKMRITPLGTDLVNKIFMKYAFN